MLLTPPFISELIQYNTLGAALGIILFCYIQEDAALILSASLASSGLVPLWVSWTAVLFGIYSGDLAIYFVARVLRKPMKALKANKANRAATTFTARAGNDYSKISNKELFMSRFVPGLRTVVYGWCGLKCMPILRFGHVVFWSGVVWTILVYILIYGIGMQMAQLPLYWKALPVVLFIGLILWGRRQWQPAFLKQNSDDDDDDDSDGADLSIAKGSSD
jgi:undecaprenyl-diphosphatase